MPSFTTRMPNIRATGPVVEIFITSSAHFQQVLKPKPEELPQPVKATALIDTGATGTVIQEGIAQKLGLSPVGVTHISTPSSENVLCEQYEVDLLFMPNNVRCPDIVVLQAPLGGQSIQCLIGRDVLSNAVFIYTGYDNSFTLAF